MVLGMLLLVRVDESSRMIPLCGHVTIACKRHSHTSHISHRYHWYWYWTEKMMKIQIRLFARFSFQAPPLHQ
eukprot:scaffold12131_cov71-Cyclotella_meneghiniana.AAC.3